MVQITASLALAVLATTGSATNLYLVTRNTTQNGKQDAIYNQLIGYDNNTLTPCDPDYQEVWCSFELKDNYPKQSSCDAGYFGKQHVNWDQLVGNFQNTAGIYDNGGSIKVTYKNSSSFSYNVKTDSHCKPFSCVYSSSSTRLDWKGFKCAA